MKSYLLILVVFVLYSCTVIKNPPSPPPMDKDWILNSSPNSLDIVGSVFAVDKNGNQKSIPGGSLILNTRVANIEVSQQSKSKDFSFGALVNFLGIKNIESGGNASIYDTAHLNASFMLNSGRLTRIDDDITKAFNNKRSVIESNIKILGLQDDKLFIILETIQSNDLNITLNKSSVLGGGVDVAYNKIIEAKPSVKSNVAKTSRLVYKREDLVTVFYKLNVIEVDTVRDKGTGDVEYKVSLGTPLNDELLIKQRVDR